MGDPNPALVLHHASCKPYREGSNDGYPWPEGRRVQLLARTDRRSLERAHHVRTGGVQDGQFYSKEVRCSAACHGPVTFLRRSSSAQILCPCTPCTSKV